MVLHDRLPIATLKAGFVRCRGKLEDDVQWKVVLSEVQAEMIRQCASPSITEYAIEQMSKQRTEMTERLVQQQAKIHALVDHINEVEVRTELGMFFVAFISLWAICQAN